MVSELRYSPWGEVRSQAGTTSTDYQYTGQFSYAADFGLLYYNARWYDPSLGRFAQADTIIPQSQGVQAYDRYAYVNNNPVKYTDPSGHAAWNDNEGKNRTHCDLDCWRERRADDEGSNWFSSIWKGYEQGWSNFGNGDGGGNGDNHEPISGVAAFATVLDTIAAGANGVYAITGDIIFLVCNGCYSGVIAVYQLYSYIPNIISSGATELWFLEGIRTGQTHISINLEAADMRSNGFSITEPINGFNISLSIDQDTAVSVVTNTAGWTVLKEPNAAFLVDAGVALYDYGRTDVFPIQIPAVNPTFSYSSNSGWNFSWFPRR